MKLFEKTLSSETKFDGRIITVKLDDVELQNGSTAKREIVCHNGGVCAAVLTEQDEILLVRQFRYPYKEVLLELPAGKLEKGEDPFEAVKREQLEETGTTGKNYTYLGDLYKTHGYCGEIIHMFAAKGLKEGAKNLDEDEFLEAEKFPLEQVIEMILSGEIKDAKTQAAVLKIAEMKRRGEF